MSKTLTDEQLAERFLRKIVRGLTTARIRRDGKEYDCQHCFECDAESLTGEPLVHDEGCFLGEASAYLATRGIE